MSAAVQAHEMIQTLFTIMTLQSAVLAQALDLRGIRLKGPVASGHYDRIRKHIPFVERDQALGQRIESLKAEYAKRAFQGERL
jgi:histidine ammonia-lyase